MGGDAAENAAITKGLLANEIQGSKKTALLLNAGAALFIAEKGGKHRGRHSAWQRKPSAAERHWPFWKSTERLLKIKPGQVL